MCLKKKSDDQCLRMGGPCSVKPIVTSSQPWDLSNYSLAFRAYRGDYRYMERGRRFLSLALYHSLQSMKPPLLTPVQTTPLFLLSSCPSLSLSNSWTQYQSWDNIRHACVCVYQFVYELPVQVDVFSCDCVLVRWDAMWERLWQLHYLGVVSLSACACFLSLSPLSQSNIYLLPWRSVSSLYCLSVNWSFHY